jgi:hypothetical protein
MVGDKMSINWSDIVGDKYAEDEGGFVGSLLTLARAHVSDALDKNELTQAEAGQIYTAMIPAAMQHGIGFAMQEELTEAKIANEGDKLETAAKQRDVLQAQEELYRRQKAGFDDNKFQKILDSQMNGWGITFQDTDTTYIPNQIGQAEFDKSFTAARKDYYV